MCKKRMARLRERTKSCGTSRATEDDSTPLRPLCDQDRTADATICALACPYSLALYIATMLASGTTPAGMEWSVHTCPKTIRTEVAGVLPSADLDKLLIVPTCQQATMELVQFGEEVDKQKDELLERVRAAHLAGTAPHPVREQFLPLPLSSTLRRSSWPGLSASASL